MMLRRNFVRSVQVSCLGSRTSTTVAAVDVDPKILNARPYEEIPKIPSLPLIGSVWTMMPIIGKYKLRQFDQANILKYKEYGKILREDMTTFNKLLHLFEPADFEQVFRNEGRYPERRPFASLLRAFQEDKNFNSLGLLNTNGEEWWSLRSAVQPHMMKPKTTASYLPAVDQVAQEFIQRMKILRDKNTLEIDNYADELRRFALESVGLVAVDARLGCLSLNIPLDSDAMVIMKTATKIFDTIFQLEFFNPWWRLFETPKFKEFKDTVHNFSRITFKYVQQAKLRLEQERNVDRELTILENLMVAKVEPGKIGIMINDLFLGGVDSTYVTGGFFLYHMAKNPEAQEKARQEINRLLPHKNSPITLEVLNESRYLKACLKESMRVSPVGPGTVRKITKDTVIAGYRVPAETQIFLHTFVACQDEKNFPEPMKFRPERWSRDNKESNVAFAHLPFGFGPRSCVGRRIAEQELWTLIIRILQNFRVEYHHEDIGVYTTLAFYPDKPLKFQFKDV